MHPVIQVEALLWELEERGVDPGVIARYVQLSINRTLEAEGRLARQAPADGQKGRQTLLS